MGEYYDQMISRNWAFISPNEQDAIRSTRLLMAGCGLGSLIAEMALRTGFLEFTLADHDVVDVSNLNRQAFTASDVGQNKATALSAHIKAICPEANVRALTDRIEPDGVDALVATADIVVNTVDFDHSAWALNRAARNAGVPVLFPMNMAWGGFCMVFMPDSPGLEQLIGTEPPRSDAEFLGRLFSRIRDFEMPGYLAERLSELPQIVSSARLPAPQTAIAAARSASLTVEAMVRLATDMPMRVSPRAMYLDGWEDWGS